MLNSQTEQSLECTTNKNSLTGFFGGSTKSDYSYFRMMAFNVWWGGGGVLNSNEVHVLRSNDYIQISQNTPLRKNLKIFWENNFKTNKHKNIGLQALHLLKKGSEDK